MELGDICNLFQQIVDFAQHSHLNIREIEQSRIIN